MLFFFLFVVDMFDSCTHKLYLSYNYVSPQPGYRYGSVSLKSRPMSQLPLVHNLAQVMKSYCGVDNWNIGVNVICYRDDNDRMGFHSDNDQNESMILAIVPNCPDESERKIIIRTKTTTKKIKKNMTTFNVNGERCYEVLEIQLKAGDGYDMDGTFIDILNHNCLFLVALHDRCHI